MRLAVALAVALGSAGCASTPLDSLTRLGSVRPLPAVAPLAGQSPADLDWDVRDCQAEAGHQTNYSPTDSPLGNFFQKLFFWGTAGAAVGGTFTGFPVIVDESTASTGLIVGSSTGAATGTALSVGSQRRYEDAWIACMTARGYAVE